MLRKYWNKFKTHGRTVSKEDKNGSAKIDCKMLNIVCIKFCLVSLICKIPI